MAINLRVVGIFFNADIETGGTVSVHDLLKMAQDNPPEGVEFKVDFANTAEGSPSTITATYSEDFTSPVLHRPYNKGTYSMSEDLNASPVYSVWQYYIFNDENVFLNRGNGGVPPTQAMVEDGQSVILRLVNIHADAATNDSLRLNRAAMTS